MEWNMLEGDAAEKAERAFEEPGFRQRYCACLLLMLHRRGKLSGEQYARCLRQLEKDRQNYA